MFGPLPRRSPHDLALNAEYIPSNRSNTKEPQLTKKFTPRITTSPIFHPAFLVNPPSDDGNNVRCTIARTGVIVYAPAIRVQFFSIDACSYWSPHKYFSLYCINVEFYCPIFRHRRIWKNVHLSTPRMCTSPTGIDRGAGKIHVLTNAILKICRTRNVGHAGVKRYESVLLHKFIETRSAPTMTRSGDIGTAVEYKLYR